MKCIFYLLEFKKEDICIPGTQRFFWKTARHLWNDSLIDKMQNYHIEGPKTSEVKSYQTINFIERNLDGIAQEDLNRYNFALGLVFKWLRLAIAARKQSIIKRLANSKRLREEREMKIEEERARKEDR